MQLGVILYTGDDYEEFIDMVREYCDKTGKYATIQDSSIEDIEAFKVENILWAFQEYMKDLFQDAGLLETQKLN
jgi:hypothetical protein